MCHVLVRHTLLLHKKKVNIEMIRQILFRNFSFTILRSFSTKSGRLQNPCPCKDPLQGFTCLFKPIEEEEETLNVDESVSDMQLRFCGMSFVASMGVLGYSFVPQSPFLFVLGAGSGLTSGFWLFWELGLENALSNDVRN